MRIAQVLAGISLAEADVLRKAVGKKDKELIQEELGKFTAKAIARGYKPQIINELAAQIETFGRYGFVRSHATWGGLHRSSVRWWRSGGSRSRRPIPGGALLS